MDQRLEKLERAVEALEAAVSRQERRLAALEGRDGEARTEKHDAADLVEPVAAAATPLSDQWPTTALRGTPALVGRSLLILAGAFLLRALTEAGTLATGTGVVFGLAYAASWIIAAAMAARKGARASAGFFAVCAALIADPLIFEAATEFGVLSPFGSALALALMTAAGLVVASRWRLQESAWVFAVGAMIAAAALAVVRPPGEAATAVLVALGLSVVWLPSLLGWESLRWLTAVGADIGALRLTAMATAPGGPHGFDAPHVLLVAVLQGALLLGYVGSSVTRALRGRYPIRVFDVVQTAVVWAVGWGGAVQVARANDVGTRGLAGFALVVGLFAYASAFGVVDRRQGRNRSFLYLSTLGLALMLVGIPGVFGAAGSAMWAFLAVIGAAAGSHWDRVTLRVHAAILLLVAWVVSGVAGETVADLFASAAFDGEPRAVPIVVFVATLVSTLVVLLTRRLKSPGWAQRMPLTALLVMSGLVLAVTIVWAATLFSPASAQWMGTVALSAVTIAFAVLASRWGVREAGWVVYPMLALTGVRVVLADLASGRTVVLVIALAAYGAALILSPRLVRAVR